MDLESGGWAFKPFAVKARVYFYEYRLASAECDFKWNGDAFRRAMVELCSSVYVPDEVAGWHELSSHS